MSTPFRSQMSHSTADGTVETRNGACILRFERHFHHPIQEVWAAITEPEQLVAWLAETEIEPRQGGHVRLRWLNTDERGNSAVMNATITQFDPPRLLEYSGDIHGLLRWELQEGEDGCILTFSNTLSISDEQLRKNLAGWHVHLDFLAEALHGLAVDWPHWPLDRWSELYEHYCQIDTNRIGKEIS
ncbi:MAG: SRPBCC family protein [Ktedonobacteraceae bacterium]|nr:SRPBCC family protein [Ktedonobacteraceae bacterium]